MRVPASKDSPLFQDAMQGLKAGDFSRLEPLFSDDSPADGRRCQIIEWYKAGLFADERIAIEEALTCACFLGCTSVAEYLLDQGIDSTAGANTGLNGFHCAVNRGHLDTVMLLIHHKAPLETRNMYGGTVLGTAIWSAINEPRANHTRIIDTLIRAGASLNDIPYPIGSDRVDEVLRRYKTAS